MIDDTDELTNFTRVSLPLTSNYMSSKMHTGIFIDTFIGVPKKNPLTRKIKGIEFHNDSNNIILSDSQHR